MIFTSSKEHWKLSKNDGFCECCIMTFLKTTIRDEDNQYYKKISWLPGCGIMRFLGLNLLLLGVAGVDKGREGWGKGREDWGEKVADSLSFLFLFSLPHPSPSLHLPLRLLWLLWTRYTLGFSKATVCLVSRKTLPAYHIMNIFCLNTNFFLSS